MSLFSSRRSHVSCFRKRVILCTATTITYLGYNIYVDFYRFLRPATHTVSLCKFSTKPRETSHSCKMLSAAGHGDRHPLFGGAISARIPQNARDISDLREVPDNQEVFAHDHTDQSLIVELLEFDSQVEDKDAAKYHFEDIAGSNKALKPGTCDVTSVVPLSKSELSLSECSSAWLLNGAQCVSKFNEEARNAVTIHLGLFRLPQFSTDVLVTFNDPLSISPDSSSSSSSASGTQSAEPWTVQDFHRLLHSFTLHDPGLFG